MMHKRTPYFVVLLLCCGLFPLSAAHQRRSVAAQKQIQQGSLALHRGNYQVAAVHFEKAADLYCQQKDYRTLALLFEKISTIYHSNANPLEAASYLELSLQLMEGHTSLIPEATDHKLGEMHKAQSIHFNLLGCYALSLHHIDQAIAYFKKLPAPKGLVEEAESSREEILKAQAVALQEAHEPPEGDPEKALFALPYEAEIEPKKSSGHVITRNFVCLFYGVVLSALFLWVTEVLVRLFYTSIKKLTSLPAVPTTAGLLVVGILILGWLLRHSIHRLLTCINLFFLPFIDERSYILCEPSRILLPYHLKQNPSTFFDSFSCYDFCRTKDLDVIDDEDLQSITINPRNVISKATLKIVSYSHEGEAIYLLLETHLEKGDFEKIAQLLIYKWRNQHLRKGKVPPHIQNGPKELRYKF